MGGKRRVDDEMLFLGSMLEVMLGVLPAEIEQWKLEQAMGGT